MRRFAMVALALSLSAGVWAPSALGAPDPQPSGDPGIERPDQGMRGDRPQGDQQFQPPRGRRGGPGSNGEQPPERPRWGGRGQSGEQPPERPRWGGQGQNGEQPQDKSGAEPGNQRPTDGDGSVGDAQRTRGQGQRPHGPRHGRPAPGGSRENEEPAL